jgi:1-acyl-sn-glycerol-3-phosphate acyltransferase
LRVAVRVLWLMGEVMLALLDFIINVVFRPKVPLARARAVWLQQTCRTALRILKVELRTEGAIPLQGLLACKQPSYLDVLVIGAITPTIFVSRSEIKHWPIFGWFASMAGTLFVNRSKRTEVTRLNREMSHAFEGGNLIVLFPERYNSASGGELPFKSALLEPATRLRIPLAAATIGYSALFPLKSSGESQAREELPSAPTWLELLAGPGFAATIRFTRVETGPQDRKELALRLRNQVCEFEEPETAGSGG